MISIIADAIKFRILEFNAIRLKRRELIAAAMCDNMNSIIDQYLGDHKRLISLGAADACVREHMITFAGHTLVVIPHVSSDGFDGIILTYSRTCKPLDRTNAWNDLKGYFDWKDYIEFILTGYNYDIFDSMYDILRFADYGEFERYIRCCPNGDAQSLSEHLLADLRSEILNAE